jgi:PAS domain S-box-containing protein
MPARVPVPDSVGLPGAELLATVDVLPADLLPPLERVFDDLPNVVFFVKDRAGRYLFANETLARRCGVPRKAALLGKKPSDIFPQPLATLYERQDERVLRSGRPILHRLELHLYHSGQRGWCITSKHPIRDRRAGEICALMGISRDVDASASGAPARAYPELARALEAMHERVSAPPTVAELAAMSGQSAGRFTALIRRLFQLTPRDLMMQIRLDEALHALTTTGHSIAEIALATGFCDQSAFTRHFRRLTGLPPATFRARFGKRA